ncbi:MAG: hypothetical protein JSU94_10740 [Phycisphaerales bacterium]|nr:MAG: hypothetical protein JSU94_10740 [Phycisphaerales bacterium]
MNRQRLISAMIFVQFALSSTCVGRGANAETLMKLTKWERGLKVESRTDKAGFAYFWFYEWHLFDAITKGEHTHGSHNWKWNVNAKGTLAQMNAEWLKMKVRAAEDGAIMTLEITNTTDHDWPEIAAIIPCFNPGNPRKPQEQNRIFLDEDHEHTYFLGADGLDLIKGQYPREIHFNHEHRPAIMAWQKERKYGTFVFSEKWPTSSRDAYAGLLVRESEDKKWTMGIAWESFISAQGHNPWKCMHLSIRVGPLKKGQSKVIRGRIYLLKGSKEDCLKRFKKDFFK